MNEELNTATANRINELHKVVMSGVEQTKDVINKTMQASVEIGMHVEQIPRGVRMAWLRDNCPGITQEQIASYLTIAKINRRRPDEAIDHQYFKLMDLVETKESYQKPTKGFGPNWLAWTGKLAGYFSKFTADYPIDKWMPQEKESIAAQLKPIAELYKKITEE